ncbi:Cna B-type domain-containing protein [uncultured Solobacterium sp.]|uniref:Cna B-type domain-containing protein n=1 Tax=uncultured Solobacterium sp. TaxID=747375 RepID=UPI0028D279BE|nr:Cna B-type domain-containing protein [uncultured Solobacterium sp.]
MLKKKIMRLVLSMLMALVMLFQGVNFNVYAGSEKEVDLEIQNIVIKNGGNPVNSMQVGDEFRIEMNWKAKAKAATINAGDYFIVKLPDNILIKNDAGNLNFSLTAPDGSVMANAHVTPKAGGGAEIKVTFTNYVNGRYDINGTLGMNANFNKDKVTVNQKNNFDIEAGGKTTPFQFKVDGGPTGNSNEVLHKYSFAAESINEAEWRVRINYKKANFPNAVVTDTLVGTTEKFVKESFRLYRVNYTSDLKENNRVRIDLSDKIVFSNNDQTFTINLGNINGEQYKLEYRTTYTPGTNLRNNVKLTSNNNKVDEKIISYKKEAAGGTGVGILANKIKLVKVDAEDNTVVLANAVFEVTGTDGSKFELTTAADGTVTSPALVAGTYKVKEKTAPAGYELNTQEFTLTVSPTSNAIQTVKDEPIRTSVKATKQWVGPIGSAVTVHLYADDVDTGKTVTLNAANNWEDTFTNLRKYKPGTTTEIKYTVKEDAIANYNGVVSGDMATGFTITNTNTEKTTVKVTKTWVGTPAASVTIKLLADGAEKETVTLTATDNWTHTFTNLDKYANDGHEIVYTVDETPVAGYAKDISGTAATGFTVKNTNTATINIPVTKTWVGTAGTSATIKLLADGAEKETVTLTAADNWTHTFSNLPKFDTTDGHEIVYTVDEVDVPNYTKGISGTAATGFTVTNTITGKVSVPVTKVWVGPQASSAKVTLFADGVEKDSVTLNATNGWAHTFTNLDKYNNGTEIVYTVTEEPIANYDSVVTGDAATGFKVTNTNTEKTSVDVTKTWVGTPAASVTIKLFADGIEKETVTLTAADNWTHTFANLDKYAADGHEIVYTVDETPVTDYIKAITGDAANGFTITNTITGKVNIPVTKVWVGPEATSAKVTLYADGVEKDSVTLNAANNWVHVFANLDKYNNGTEIVYTLTEEPISNYDSAITGDVATGFTVTNTNTEKVAVDVTKNWVGPATDSVTIKLLADGAEVESAVITAAENWMHTFSNLPKYAADGHEIVYTVDEYDVPSYVKAIEGTSTTGFTVTNTITGKVDIPVTKVWVGPATDSVTVNLYADGVKVDTVQLTAASQWKHIFANLDKYENGREIVYTVDEVLIPGYKTKITGDVQTGFTITNSKETPKTADHVNPMAYASIFVISLMAAIMTMIEKKKFAR